ncbi:zinc finger domain-containing protein [Streptomyces antibioticus]|uniref:zinc finger domain-containing protein n=1 Tax=Streptomyces antibioticus TaxID=1890 RepID=UPI0033DE2173
MITFEDASTLLGLAAARDQRTVGRADILAWQADLSAAGLTRSDAETALTAFYQEMASRQPKDRYRVTAVDLIDIAKRARRERVANLRYDGDPDETPEQYLTRLRARTAALADGRIGPDTGLRALGPGTPDPRLLRELEAVGHDVPEDGPAGSRRPVRVGPLTVPCPACLAPLGRHCRSNGRVRTVPHAARRRAARDAHDLPREDTAQIAARKEAAAAHLARLTAEERAQLEQFQQQLATGDAS